MSVVGALKYWAATAFILTLSGAYAFAAKDASGVIEKKTSLETVKSDLEDGLGLTAEQKNKIAAVREEFKARQAAIKNALNAKNEALRQELDGENPVRAKVEPIVAEIQALQGQLLENRIDVVFKLRDIYTSKQIKKIKERLQQQRKTIGKKKGIKGSKTPIKRKKTGAK